MCGNSDDYSRRMPEQMLSDAIRRELGVHIDPQALRMFIRSHWTTVSVTAHRIHEAT